MAKFKLIADPIFKCKVLIARPGQEDGSVEFTFKHYPVNELAKFEDELKNNGIIDFIMKIVAGWSLNDEFNQDNMQILLNNYPSASQAITTTYYKELFGQREKN
ncbi:phage tail assembly chaperone [Gilliamella sp. wkB171]|uniref:phage tail assembly chaperone n=1 Tax=Gilliamella sp. wkB171 TaxID=3120258 RepID=UPI0008135E55|nr:phage tail assembly chaperone [Gilliamella apicola]OCL25954.1 hypothetical protein A9G03_02625 [Gilliamella apicola]